MPAPIPGLSLIVAVANDGAMGKNGVLPWHLPADLKFFKETTMGKPMLMGRKTFESFPKTLPGRLHVVLSRQELSLPESVVLVHSLEEGLEVLKAQNQQELFVIGGAVLFREAMPFLQRAYITRVETTVPDADTFFPKLDMDQWQLISSEPKAKDERNAYDMVFEIWERKAQV